ncbi:MAG: response regulator transcription factor [Candidatus Obscuribacterales bacterium]|nr:response regulator transcription factor [Candidatus Obscuribacterales bacterium]
MVKILVVEDNIKMLEAIKDVLRFEKHSVDCAANAKDALHLLKSFTYEVMVVDWEMPDMSGVEFVRKFREKGGTTPILMLTGRSATSDKIFGLDCGADYYLTKPLDAAELLGFVRAGLRRSPQDTERPLQFADVELFVNNASIKCGQSQAKLTAKEVAVLQFLLQNAHRIVTYEQLKEAGWSDDVETPINKMRVFLTSLREKIQTLGSKLRILSVRGVGYRLDG